MSRTALRITMVLSLLVAGAAFTMTGCDVEDDCIGEACNTQTVNEGDPDPLGTTCGMQCSKLHETCKVAPGGGDGPGVCSTVCEDDEFDPGERDCVQINPCDDQGVHLCLDKLPPPA